MHLGNISASVVQLWNGRDLIEFTSDSGGIYTDREGLSLSKTENGNNNGIAIPPEDVVMYQLILQQY